MIFPTFGHWPFWLHPTLSLNSILWLYSFPITGLGIMDWFSVSIYLSSFSCCLKSSISVGTGSMSLSPCDSLHSAEYTQCLPCFGKWHILHSSLNNIVLCVYVCTCKIHTWWVSSCIHPLVDSRVSFSYFDIVNKGKIYMNVYVGNKEFILRVWPPAQNRNCWVIQ